MDNTPSPTDPPIAIVRPQLYLHEAMAARQVRTVQDLVERLKVIGVKTSPSQLGRVVNNRVEMIPLDLLGGLMAVFDCKAGDLFTAEHWVNR